MNGTIDTSHMLTSQRNYAQCTQSKCFPKRFQLRGYLEDKAESSIDYVGYTAWSYQLVKCSEFMKCINAVILHRPWAGMLTHPQIHSGNHLQTILHTQIPTSYTRWTVSTVSTRQSGDQCLSCRQLFLGAGASPTKTTIHWSKHFFSYNFWIIDTYTGTGGDLWISH